MISSSNKRLAVAGTSTGRAPFGSNCVRLSGREWLVVAFVVTALFCFVPMLWQRVETFEPGPDYRLPYKLSNNYWLYSRYCRWNHPQEKILVVGDSVIWGHYVSKENTLSGHLNKLVPSTSSGQALSEVEGIAGRDLFANMGVDGIHPVALAGLLKYYGRDVSGKDIILHFNPLWMSSRKHDLQIEKEFNFNHPRLVPQFTPNIACYKDSYSKKISAIVQRYVAFSSWVSHLRITYFESMDIPTWTLEHPYKNPLKAVTLELPASDGYNWSENLPWYEKGITRQDFQWVALETSLQWRFFRRSVELLRERGNRVFVLVGPLNEHILKGESIDTYQQIKHKIELWLEQNDIPYYIPAVLLSEMYCDASHPLNEGYAVLVRQLFENESFRLNFLH